MEWKTTWFFCFYFVRRQRRRQSSDNEIVSHRFFSVFEYIETTKMSSKATFRWFLLLSLFSLTLGQIPRKCAVDSSVAAGRCCPVGVDGSACNAASGRGRCGSLETPDRYKHNFLKRFPDATFDDRFQWPWRAFDQVRRLTFFLNFKKHQQMVFYNKRTTVNFTAICMPWFKSKIFFY